MIDCSVGLQKEGITNSGLSLRLEVQSFGASLGRMRRLVGIFGLALVEVLGLRLCRSLTFHALVVQSLSMKAFYRGEVYTRVAPKVVWWNRSRHSVSI